MHKNKFAFCLILAVVLGLCANIGASDRNVPFQHNQSRMNRLHSVPKEAWPPLPPDFKLPGEAQKPCQTSAEAGTGAISGHVTKAAGGGGILGVTVTAYGHACPYAGGNTTTAADGSYTIANLPPGWYGVYTGNDSVYVDINWNNKTYLNPDSVQVTSSTTTPNIDFSLRVGGKITGTLTLTGSSYCQARVEAIDTTTNEPYYDYPSNSGDSAPFTVKRLPAGTYRLKTYNGVGYIDVYFNNKSTKATADLIAVTEGGTFSGKNLTLGLGGTIQGLVDCFDTTLTGVLVWGFYVPDPEWRSFGFTDEDGNYTLTGLRSGNWKIIALGDTTYAYQWWWLTDTWSSADTVNVTAPETTISINFSLDPGGSISGHVYDLGGHPLSGCYVSAYDSSSFLWGMIVKHDTTSSDGSYKITGLGTGNYKVEASIECAAQYYDHSSTPQQADIVHVDEPSDHSGINFNLPSAVEDKENQTASRPSEFELSQNYPNPFNPGTEIEYALHKSAQVNLTIYNLLGQKVKTLLNEHQQVGSYKIFWDGKNEQGKISSSGIYFYRLEVNGVPQTKRMVLLK